MNEKRARNSYIQARRQYVRHLEMILGRYHCGEFRIEIEHEIDRLKDVPQAPQFACNSLAENPPQPPQGGT